MNPHEHLILMAHPRSGSTSLFQVLQWPDCRVILLRRKNLLKAVVSVLIAEQTQLWHTWDARQPITEYYRDLKPLDIDGPAGISARIRAINEQIDFLEHAADAHPIRPPLKLIYEDFYFAPVAEQERMLATIWQFLDLEPVPRVRYERFLRSEETMMNSAQTYAFLPNIDEIEAACGSDETGWLFQ
jgi:LPS sulfotransferase NodH